MTNVAAELRKPTSAFARIPFYYGWVIIGVAALAMVGTLPGRTQGLGLITESLLKDLNLDRVVFAQMNLWATLLGSLFCLGFGRLLDQPGSRVVLTTVALALGAVVLAMSGAHSAIVLFLLLTLSRGLGQSALSVTSLTMVGQWFNRRLSVSMGIYSVLLSIGFMAAFPIVGGAVLSHGWRNAWAGIGWFLILGLAPMGWLLVRRGPESCGLELEGESTTDNSAADYDFTWLEALWTPAFWVFALASSAYNLVASGIGLFNESILAERGFSAGIYHQSLVITALTSLVGNFLGGWLAAKWSVNRLMALAMALLTVALLAVPWLRVVWQVNVFAVVMGVAGGFVIVIFFSFWAGTFGRKQLGRIQGTAQMLTVLASALGPLLLAKCHAWTGSYAAVFYALAAVVMMLGLAAWLVPMPHRTSSKS
jgi:MFS family permease